MSTANGWQFIVTDDVAKLMGSDLQLTVQLYSEGQKVWQYNII